MGPRIYLQFLFCLLGGWLTAQTPYELGKIHDSILVSDTDNETFALYLPKSYSNTGLSSIVFIFEPMGRGAVGIQPFVSASEKYGHVLVCSNSSRNAPYPVNFDIANNLFTHIFSNFNIHDDEMYTAGFSGGSRLASAIASLTDKFIGVVGCGAGFSGLQEHMPSAQKYAYVGLCGDRDMNYKEMIENKGSLHLIKFNSTLITYSGEHRWPPQEQMLRAFDWLHLQKLKKEKPINKDKVLDYYQLDATLLKQFGTNDEILFEAEQYERMIQSYKGVLSVDSLSQQYSSLLKSKNLKKQLAALEGALEIERKWMGKLETQLQKAFSAPEKTNWTWWEKELKKLSKLREKDDVEIQKMVSRIHFDLFVRVHSRRNTLIHQQSQSQSKLIEEFLALLNSNKG